MNRHLFWSLAWQGMKRNRRTTLPYLFSLTGIVMMFFILSVLSATPSLEGIYGSRTLRRVLEFGVYTITVFSVIVVFYTRSFLTRSRKKEFGLFNILGLEKCHLLRVMAIETLLVGLMTMLAGIGLGAVFSKLMYLMLLRLLGSSLTPVLAVPKSAVSNTLLLFLFIHTLTLLDTLRQIAVTRPAELLRSARQGEKDPPARVWLAILGSLCLGGGYALATTARDPIAAVSSFFFAVLLVIVGTYALFLAGSVSLLKALRRNKAFYYQPRHFSVVAGLIHRMKRNAVGLATICILSTMVLVMVSATASMFIGRDASIKEQMGRDTVFLFHALSSREQEQAMMDVVNQVALEQNLKLTNPMTFRGQEVWAYLSEDLSRGWSSTTPYDEENKPFSMGRFTLVFAEDYSALTGRTVDLSTGEVLAFSPEESPLPERFTLFGLPFLMKQRLDRPQPMAYYKEASGQNFLLVMTGEDFYALRLARQKEEYQNAVRNAASQGETFDLSWEDFMNESLVYTLTYAFDTGDLGTESAEAFTEAAQTRAAEVMFERFGQGASLSARHLSLESADFNAQYGGLLFVAFFLGVLFILAMVLIIYYKQISEGYEDRERFVILKQVGMSQKEVRMSIKSQVLLVFFLPLFLAGIHTLMAFHIVSLILNIMNLQNLTLYAVIALGTFLVFSLFYLAVYAKTAQSYYKIVNQSNVTPYHS